MERKYVLDTNVLIHNYRCLRQYKNIILPISVLEELDNLKTKDRDLGFNARKAIKEIEKSEHIEIICKDIYDVKIDGWDINKIDNKIIFCAQENNAILISNDINVRVKAKSIGIETSEYKENCESDYIGFKEIIMNEEEMADWYGTKNKENKWNLNINEYLLIKNQTEDKIIDVWRLTEKGFKILSYPKKIDSTTLGKFISKDVYQNCVLDSLYNNQLTMIKGKAGTGKSLIALSYAMSQIEKGKYDKLIIFCNPVASKNAAKLGFLPGSQYEKLLDSSVGHMLRSKFGGEDGLEVFVKKQKVKLLPFSDIRGFDTTGMNAICWFVEAQNLDIELMKLAIQRVGDDSQVIIDGDYNAQVDSCAYEADKNGMRRVSQVFRGENCYGEIELQTIYRSKIAEIADRM